VSDKPEKKKPKRRVASPAARKVAADKTIVTREVLPDGTVRVRNFTRIGAARSRGDVLHHRGPPLALKSQLRRLRKKLKKDEK